jgi:hypothetical protein
VTPEVFAACAELWELEERACWENVGSDGWPTGKSRSVLQ